MFKMTAHQVLQQYWEPDKFPINPKEIAKKAGIEVIDEWLLGHSGSYDPPCQEHPARITVAADESIVRQRFTLAHELGHHFLNHGQAFRDTFDTQQKWDYREVEANQFAADLLMPANAVRRLAIQPSANISTLAQTFAVSEIAMRIRLERLGFV